MTDNLTMQARPKIKQHKSSIAGVVTRNADFERQINPKHIEDKIDRPTLNNSQASNGTGSNLNISQGHSPSEPRSSHLQHKIRGQPYRSAKRANVRGQIHNDIMTQVNRSQKRMKNIMDTNTIHYNPTGPGDYTLPSSFGELPPPRTSEKAILSTNVVKKPPAYSIGVPINNNRIYLNNLQSMHSVNAPPLGTYNPIDPNSTSFEDKAKMKLMRASRWNPYQAGSQQTASRKTLASQTQSIQNNPSNHRFLAITDQLDSVEITPRPDHQ